MKGGILRKIKSVSTFTSLKHNLVFQVNRPTQYFQTNEDLDNDISPEMFCQTNAPDLAKEHLLSQKGELFSTLAAPKNMSTTDHNEKIENTSTQEFETHHSCNTVPLSDHPQDLQESDTMEIVNSSRVKDEENKDLCPPGGNDSVIFYTTSLRGIRKTFEDCSTIRFLLESFRVVYNERDVSMHVEYREELWRILGGRVVPPRLFIRGKHIGGADEVVELHEQGILKKLLHGIPLLLPSTSPCKGCSGIKFVLCFSCHGSCKITDLQGKAHEYPIRCPECNENGLIKCPLCS